MPSSRPSRPRFAFALILKSGSMSCSASAEASSSSGFVRGLNSVRYQLPKRPSIRRFVFRNGRRPARSSDDLPDPEPPSTATTWSRASRDRTASMSRSRPKKISPSPGSKDLRPGYGMGTIRCRSSARRVFFSSSIEMVPPSQVGGSESMASARTASRRR